MFRFALPEMFYLMLLIPVLVSVYIFYVRSKAKRMARFGNPELVRALAPEISPSRVRNKFIIYLLAVVFIITALARPQSGAKLKEVTREGIELIFAVDVSNSMLARDFEPNRLERTKYAIGRLLEELEQDKVGLVVFAGDAYMQLPITSDYVTARNFVRHLSPDMVSKQGTAIGAAIDLASNSFSSDSEGSRVIIIISDGENHEDDPLAAARAAAEKGITIYTIGIGTIEGVVLEIGGEYIRDEEGNIVVTRLDEQTLEQIALITGGAYIRSTNQSIGLNEIIERIGETEKSSFTSTVFEEYNEQYRSFLIVAAALLLLEQIMLGRKNRILSRFNIFGSRKDPEIN